MNGCIQILEVKSINNVATAPKHSAATDAYPNPNDPALGNKIRTIAAAGAPINR
ncbi:conserved hypothetical protein [Oenococcus oeni]|nr:conserved hypothetical protein [Oenococcus oeni]